MDKTLLLGLGTGRCGTTWLYDLLKQQSQSFITNEAVKFGWYYSKEILITDDPLFRWMASDREFVGDVGSYTLPHVDSICKYFQKVKIIILKRDRVGTIESWMRWTAAFHNYWVPHTGNRWRDDGYDILFPKFDLENREKEIAIGSYYDLYYDNCRMLEKKYDVFWAETEQLDKKQEDILDFCGFDRHLWRFGPCRKNESLKKVVKVEKPVVKKKKLQKVIQLYKRNNIIYNMSKRFL